MARGFVTKRGDVYYAYWRDPSGKQRSKAVSTRKKDAEAYLNQVQAQLASGTYVERKEIGFGTFAERWLTEVAVSRVKPSTLRTYEAVVRRALIPHFGETRLTAIGPEDVQRYLSVAVKSGRSEKTAGNHLVLLKTIFKQAVMWEYLHRNPAEFVKRPKVEHREMDFLTPEEVRLFLANVDDPYRALFTTAVLTGMRLGELLALQWGDIDWNKRTLHVRRSLYRGQFQSPKSKRSIRAIGMSPTLRDVLWMHKLDAPASELDLVFPSDAGTPLDPDNVRHRVFEPALRRAGLRRIRIHDLRHTFASLLIHQGENLKYVQTQLGHASIQTTLDRYGHLMPDAYLGASERLDATVFGDSPEDSAYKLLTSTGEKQKAGDSMSLRPAVSW